jgi:hypothetical protein
MTHLLSSPQLSDKLLTPTASVTEVSKKQLENHPTSAKERYSIHAHWQTRSHYREAVYHQTLPTREPSASSIKASILSGKPGIWRRKK